MRDKKRIKRILGLIEEYWNTYPDERFGQMLINLGIMEDTFLSWNVEDEETEDRLQMHINDLKKKKRK